MSSGACRALVATLLSLAALIGIMFPVAAQQENLRTRASTTYTVNPSNGRIGVVITLTFENRTGSALTGETWGPIYLENDAVPRFSRGAAQSGRVRDLPGPWKAIDISLPDIPAGGRTNVDITYRIDDGSALQDNFPVRIGQGYVFACLAGQPADFGELRVNLSDTFRMTTSGSEMEATPRGLSTGTLIDPASLFTCVEGTNERRLATDRFVGPAGRQIILQAYPEHADWLTPAGINTKRALDDVHAFLGLDIPGEDPVVIRETPEASVGGYASDHGSPGVVQVDERAGVTPSDIEHEVAHAWFTTDDYPERWMREGLAAWAATGTRGEVCEAVDPEGPAIDLAEWQVVRPTAPDDIVDVIAAQQAAACGIMSAVASRMDEETFRSVLASMLDGEVKYVGNGPAATAATRIVDYREWLDAVDERGLVPAGVEDLDFAQDLIARFGINPDPQELEERSATRRRYHDFLAAARPMAAPVVVRQAMDAWRFRDANVLLDQAEQILGALTSADELLPQAGLLTIIQDEFEAAGSSADLDLVLERASSLLGDAEEIVAPLTELELVTPDGWALPAAVRNAISERRFDDVISSIAPALRIVQDAVAADAALPEAGLLDDFQARYEATVTGSRLEELAADVAATRRQAEATGIEYATLQSIAGDWVIPAAVTDPIEAGQIALALEVSQDARGVIAAAIAADKALPEAAIAASIRPRFEAVQDAREMAALRAEAESRSNEAVTVGNALASLRRTVGDWTLPTIVTEPIDAGNFGLAATTAATAQKWVEFAAQADAELPEIGALERIREEFQAAETLDQLESGAQLASDWAQAATRVATAKRVVEAPRDLMTHIGLFGTDVTPQLDAAIDAAIEGDVAEATSLAASVIDTIQSGSSSGGLRVIGIVFLGIAILGVLGLLAIFRRQSGPPWARDTKPPWAK